MALYVFDGIWNEDESDPETDTNVIKFCQVYKGGTEDIEGTGTRFGALGRRLAGVLGISGRTKIEEMYDRLVNNWELGDREIDVVGFSRGAALAVQFANVVAEIGIRSDGVEIAKPGVRFLGVWDVINSFCIPADVALNFQGFDIGCELVVSENVSNCFHAMALNERRRAYEVTRLDPSGDRPNVEELWFRGVHGDLGGINGNTGLSNVALKWMLENAKSCGLPISEADIRALEADGLDPTAPLGEILDPVRNPGRTVHPSDGIHPGSSGKLLAPGESHTFSVRALEQYSWSGVRVEAGGDYAFEINEGETWQDKDIVCGPEGWRTEDLPWFKEAVIEPLEKRRRCPNARWFELVGSIGDDGSHFFRIGKGGADRTYRSPVDGELCAFANDLRSTYGNNHGEIKVTVKRTFGPGKDRLEACKAEPRPTETSHLSSGKRLGKGNALTPLIASGNEV